MADLNLHVVVWYVSLTTNSLVTPNVKIDIWQRRVLWLKYVLSLCSFESKIKQTISVSLRNGAGLFLFSLIFFVSLFFVLFLESTLLPSSFYSSLGFSCHSNICFQSKSLIFRNQNCYQTAAWECLQWMDSLQDSQAGFQNGKCKHPEKNVFGVVGRMLVIS